MHGACARQHLHISDHKPTIILFGPIFAKICLFLYVYVCPMSGFTVSLMYSIACHPPPSPPYNAISSLVVATPPHWKKVCKRTHKPAWM